MPARLRPTAPVAADAILVGDPGRSLMLAQELLEQPKMSNHARGLWGYSGQTPSGEPLTVQATGMGGPSAAIVLSDLAELGVRRAIRIGTCAALGPEVGLGELLLVEEALACGGSAAAFGLDRGAGAQPDPALFANLRGRLGEAGRPATVASFDAPPDGERPGGALGADLQTAAVLAHGARIGLAAAALLVVAEDAQETLDDERLEAAAKRAGHAAAAALAL